jgi:hypothetical protein
MLSPCAQPRLQFFSEATIEAGFFSTSEPNAGTKGDTETLFNSIHFSPFRSTLTRPPVSCVIITSFFSLVFFNVLNKFPRLKNDEVQLISEISRASFVPCCWFFEPC